MPEVLKEITYLSEVECLVHSADALLNTQIIGVADESGNQQYLRVAKGSITRSGEKDYLPIGIVELDRRQRRALVELPYEADSGVRRLWVPFSQFRRQEEEP